MAVNNICTLIGPTRHCRMFDFMSYELGKCGWLVFSVGSQIYNDEELGTTFADMDVYAKTHSKKIDLSSLVCVVDVPQFKEICKSYIGENTKAELAYVRDLNIPELWMSEYLLGMADMPFAPGIRPEVIVSALNSSVYCGCNKRVVD